MRDAPHNFRKGIIQLVVTQQKDKNLTHPPPIVGTCTLAKTPHCVHTLTHLTSPPPISNRNVFKYAINNSTEKKIVKHFIDRKIVIANVL